jgi:murein DD-endopeptidase MepM/ murein hydrolase activator NlpD
MGGRRWTFVVVPDPDRPARTVRVSDRWLRGGLIGAVAVVLLLLTFSVGFFAKLGEEVRQRRLAEQNALLSAHLARMRQTVDELSAALEELRRRDERYRLLSGLAPLDPDVEKVGIGGPGTETLEHLPLYEMNEAVAEEMFTTAYELNTLLRRAQLLRASFAEATEAMERNVERLKATPSIKPAQGFLVSVFSMSRYHPILHVRRPHEGIDISAPRGTPIMAAAAGTVTYAGWRPGYGLTVEIDHGYGYKTRYAHCDKILVREGNRVERGARIALVGNTGISVAPHLHYEVIKDGKPVDPMTHLISELPGIPD